MSNYTLYNAGSGMLASPTASIAQSNPVNAHTLQNFVRILTKRWKWIAGSIVICELLAVLLTLAMKPTYDATATIELNKSSSGSLDLGLDDALSQQLSSGGEGLLTDLQTETAILQGDSLALAVIQQLGLASQPPFALKNNKDPGLLAEQGRPLEDAPQTRTRLLRIFKTHLKVQPIHGTRLIQVAYEGHDPRQAAQIANALIESYKDQYLQSHYAATAEASAWLTKQLTDLKNNVEESEKKLTDFEKQTGILSLNMMMPTGSENDSTGQGQIHSVVIQKLDALNGELTAAEANRIEKEAIYRFAQSGNADVVLGIGSDPLAAQSNSLVLTQGGGLSNLQQLRQQEGQLKISLAQAETTFGANNRHLKEMQAQLQALDGQIHDELQLITRRARADFQLAQQDEDELRRQFNQQQGEASKLNEKAVQFAVLSQEAFSRKKLYEDLYTKLQEANVSAGIKATNITVVNPARSQSIPIRPKPVNNVALGMMFGLFLGFSAAFTADTLDRTVDTTLQVEALTGKPVIGVIPIFGEPVRTYGAHLPRPKEAKVSKELAISKPVWMLTHAGSSVAEAFRSLRTSIMLSGPRGGPKVVLVTGCIPGEGKTTVATNLAVAFAQHNKKVIIIEADMRRSSMKEAMHVSSEAGLSSILAGMVTADDAILHGVLVPTLDVLLAGPHPPMPSEMLGSAAFDELLDQLRTQYDLILIDSPPALMVTDAVSISPKVDGVLWVVRAGVVTKPLLTRAAESIQRNGMPVIGIVMNRVDRRSAAYGYGYAYYGSYYHEKESHEA